MKLLTVELDKESDSIELHLNKVGAEYLKGLLDRLLEFNQQDHFHLMTSDWGGDELSSEKQNKSPSVDLIHQLKIVFWED